VTGRRGALSAGLVVAALAVAALAAASLAVGVRPVPPAGVLDALRSLTGGSAGAAASTDAVVVVESRLPRTLAGLVVGAALGLTGAVMQGLTRNPLADPGLLGVNAGASVAVVVAISVLGVTAPAGYAWFAVAGAAGAAAVVYGAAAVAGGGRRESGAPVRLVLAGAAVTASCLAVVNAVLVTDQATFDAFRFWQVGALAGTSAGALADLVPLFAVGLLLCAALGPSLDSLALGDDVARSLGVRVGAARAAGAVAVVLLAGASTAVVGPLAFVGLAVPHVARRITGPAHRWVLAYSALLGPALLLVADVLGRLVARPGEVPVGVLTAVVGAPVLIALVRRQRALAL
jgi:iron complex transport system permease protein